MTYIGLCSQQQRQQLADAERWRRTSTYACTPTDQHLHKYTLCTMQQMRVTGRMKLSTLFTTVNVQKQTFPNHRANSVALIVDSPALSRTPV